MEKECKQIKEFPSMMNETDIIIKNIIQGDHVHYDEKEKVLQSCDRLLNLEPVNAVPIEPVDFYKTVFPGSQINKLYYYSGIGLQVVNPQQQMATFVLVQHGVKTVKNHNRCIIPNCVKRKSWNIVLKYYLK